jgi:hypothetical protein
VVDWHVLVPNRLVLFPDLVVWLLVEPDVDHPGFLVDMGGYESVCHPTSICSSTPFLFRWTSLFGTILVPNR